MKNLLKFEDHLTKTIDESMTNEAGGCLSENAKMTLEKACNEVLMKEAKEYDGDDNPDHTYEGYVNECNNYISEIMGNAGYSSISKPFSK